LIAISIGGREEKKGGASDGNKGLLDVFPMHPGKKKKKGEEGKEKMSLPCGVTGHGNRKGEGKEKSGPPSRWSRSAPSKGTTKRGGERKATRVDPAPPDQMVRGVGKKEGGKAAPRRTKPWPAVL